MDIEVRRLPLKEDGSYQAILEEQGVKLPEPA